MTKFLMLLGVLMLVSGCAGAFGLPVYGDCRGAQCGGTRMDSQRMD